MSFRFNDGECAATNKARQEAICNNKTTACCKETTNAPHCTHYPQASPPYLRMPAMCVGLSMEHGVGVSA